MTDLWTRDLSPDLILSDGLVTTMDPARPSAAALAVKDGRIIAVGSSSSVEALAGPATVVRRVGGRRVIPGLNDTHNHLLSMGAVLDEVQLYGARSIDEIKRLVEARVRSAPPGSWILGRGWDESLLSDRRFPNRYDLDEVAPNNPVVLERVWNMLLANTAALHAADVGRHTPDPPADVLYSGRIERDANGEPTGIFRDRAKRLIQDAIPPRTIADFEASIRTACAAYNRAGITSVAEPGLYPAHITAFANVRKAGDLTVRVSLCLAGWGFGASEAEDEIERRIADVAVFTGFGDPWLRMDTVKFLPDGGIGDRTALMFEPYANEPNNYGQFVIAERDLFERIRWCHDRGWSVDCHACGDRMIELVNRAYAAAQRARPDAFVRHRIHHAYLPTATSLELMREFRIPALATIPFITNLGESFVVSLGEERASRIMPLRTYLDAGVPLALGSDAPVTTYDPFVGIYSAVTRKTVYGRVLGADECISREEALRAFTADSAWVTFEDGIKGTLTPGKVADIAVLSDDLFAVDDEQIKELHSVLTVVDGRVVHDELGAAG